MAGTLREATIVNDTDKQVAFVQVINGDSTPYAVLRPTKSFKYSTVDNGTYGYLQVRPEHKEVDGLVIDSHDVLRFSEIRVAFERGSYVLKKKDRPGGVVARAYTALSNLRGARWGASQPNPSNDAEHNSSDEVQLDNVVAEP